MVDHQQKNFQILPQFHMAKLLQSFPNPLTCNTSHVTFHIKRGFIICSDTTAVSGSQVCRPVRDIRV